MIFLKPLNIAKMLLDPTNEVDKLRSSLRALSSVPKDVLEQHAKAERARAEMHAIAQRAFRRGLDA